LFLNICHLHNKNISPIVEKTAKEFGVPYYSIPTLGKAISSHTNKLKELGGV
jgi:linoleoyl-CoA desaturase